MSVKIIVSAFLLVYSIGANAQEQKQQQQKRVERTEPGPIDPVFKAAAQRETNVGVNSIYRTVQVKPQSTSNLNEFFAENLRYPEAARENKVQGRVVVAFVVERDGSLTNIKIIKGAELGHGIPEEAIRVVKAMPKWSPGLLNEKAVRTYFKIPLAFNLQ